MTIEVNETEEKPNATSIMAMQKIIDYLFSFGELEVEEPVVKAPPNVTGSSGNSIQNMLGKSSFFSKFYLKKEVVP